MAVQAFKLCDWDKDLTVQALLVLTSSTMKLDACCTLKTEVKD